MTGDPRTATGPHEPGTGHATARKNPGDAASGDFPPAGDHRPGGTPGAGRRHRRAAWLFIAPIAVGMIAAALGVMIIRHGREAASAQLERPSGIPADITTGLADLMSLSPLPHGQAPGFTLTDQHGQTLALSVFRGKAVVLEFMDSHCTSICPLVAQEFIDAYHDLGPLAGKVVFAAVNVDPYHAAVRDVAQFTAGHQLTSIPDWHFFTGPVSRLEAVWHAYGIEVAPRGPGADTIHTSAVYFIDRHGAESYLASPMADYTKAGSAYLPASQLASWGQGIALVARQLAG